MNYKNKWPHCYQHHNNNNNNNYNNMQPQVQTQQQVQNNMHSIHRYVIVIIYTSMCILIMPLYHLWLPLCLSHAFFFSSLFSYTSCFIYTSADAIRSFAHSIYNVHKYRNIYTHCTSHTQHRYIAYTHVLMLTSMPCHSTRTAAHPMLHPP